MADYKRVIGNPPFRRRRRSGVYFTPRRVVLYILRKLKRDKK